MLSAVLGATTLTALSQTPASATAEPTAKVAHAVLAQVDAGKKSTFFVVLDDTASLAGARSKSSHVARVTATYTALRSEARETQAPVVDVLESEGVPYESFWIANALLVTSSDADLVDELAAVPGVASIVPERHYTLDEIERQSQPARLADAATPEWGITDIGADRVWSEFADRGEGIVIANIDSGVQFDHPALVGSYRGNNHDGTFTHDYNWFDPTGQCPTAGVPCDNNGHGTHTMGTMVGADGIGVAPGATWIAAKGCQTSECSDASLLAAGQWVLAPTDRNGQNPRPDLAPNVVNNSWGGGEAAFYADVIRAWNAAGIFDAFAAGNDGDGVTCGTTAAPGAQEDTYGVGAYDASGTIADFSGFGPSPVDGSSKPNITAPGVAVRSTWPGSGYRVLDGTSMATPHVAGAVALLWAEAPSLIGQIGATRRLLGETARDVEDTHCGGTADANNVWGEGRLDVLAAVDAAPHTSAVITGAVTDADTDAPVNRMTVTAVGADATRTATTDADGHYRLTLPAGTFTITVDGYGYATSTESGYEVLTGGDATHDIEVISVPSHPVTGTVLDVAGQPIGGVRVVVAGTPVPEVTTDAAGRFTIPAVAEGDFTLNALPVEPVLCNGVYGGDLTVDAAETTTMRLPARTDAYGNSCVPVGPDWVRPTTRVAVSGDEDAARVSLPFGVSVDGATYRKVGVTTNGLIQFAGARIGDYANSALPTTSQPNATLAVFWDDLVVDRSASVRTATLGKPGKRRFAIVWTDAAIASDRSLRVSFEAVFHESNGAITLQYRGIGNTPLERGSSATIGLENQTGTDALQYSFDQAVVRNATAVRIRKATR